jgi:ABC-type transporter Mla MlaB component
LDRQQSRHITCIKAVSQNRKTDPPGKEPASKGSAVTIHVSETKHDDGRVLKVDGHLRAADVLELTSAYRSTQGNNVLDLSELQSADSAGLETLRELISLGAKIRHASPYIELLLKTKP